ncbi:MAG: hypothetical protein HOV76_04420 [Hamadaea sp.]|nr:hypothetical protein [Hamadaea sp.]
MTPLFQVVLRGYDRRQVDQVIEIAENAVDQPDVAASARAVQAIADFRAKPLVVLRGYDREQVEQHLLQLSAVLAGSR